MTDTELATVAEGQTPADFHPTAEATRDAAHPGSSPGGGTNPDDDAPAFPPLPPLPDTSHLPVLRVHRDDDGTVAYKTPFKGARWRGGFDSFEAAIAHAETDMPGHCLIDFVETRD